MSERGRGHGHRGVGSARSGDGAKDGGSVTPVPD